MNFSLLNVALFGAGALLIAAAIKGKNPRDLIADSISGAGKASTVPTASGPVPGAVGSQTGYSISTPVGTPGVVVTSP